MSIIRRRFTKEQKLEIVNQSMAEGISIESLAEQYKIHSNSIYKWRRQYLKYEDASFPGNGNKMVSSLPSSLPFAVPSATPLALSSRSLFTSAMRCRI